MNPLRDSGFLDLNDAEHMECLSVLTTEQEHHADIELMAANNERERKLWGKLLADKRFLQQRGLGVWWKDRKRGLIHCGGRIITRAQLATVVERERRLLTKTDSVTISG